jgi:hypothetical protein
VQASLSLEGNGLTSVPQGLTQLSALCALDMSCNALSTLPPGPYLAGLEMLSLASNRLVRVRGRAGLGGQPLLCAWQQACTEGRLCTSGLLGGVGQMHWAAIFRASSTCGSLQVHYHRQCDASCRSRPAAAVLAGACAAVLLPPMCLSTCSSQKASLCHPGSPARSPCCAVLRLRCAAQVPAALSCARSCEVLDITQNPQLELARPDVDCALLQMPKLGLLLLGKWPGCTAAMDWHTGERAAVQQAWGIHAGPARGPEVLVLGC